MGTTDTASIDTVVDIIRTHGVGRTDHPALIEGSRQLTWGQLYARAGQVANLFASAGVGNQDRVAFLDKNSIEHFEVFFGGLLLNAVCVDVNWRLAAPEVEYIVNDAQAKVLVVGPDFVPVLEAIAPNLVHTSLVLVIGGAPGYADYNEVVATQPTTDPGASAAAFSLDASRCRGDRAR